MSDVDLNGRHVSGVAMCFFLPNYVILLITSALNGYGVVGGGLAWVFGVGGGGYWSEETSSIICESWVCLGIESNPYGKLVIGERFVAGLVSRIMCWVVSHIRPRVLKVDGYVCVCDWAEQLWWVTLTKGEAQPLHKKGRWRRKCWERKPKESL